MKNAIKSMGIVSKPSTSQPQSSIDQQRAKKRKKESTNRTTESKAKSDGIGVLSGPGEQNASNFSLMSKIVDYMKKRHLDLHYWPLSLQECIDEMNIGIVPKRTMTWLEDTIKNNHRLQVKDDGKFEYKPPHRVKNQKMLLDLFKRRHFESEGATLLSDLNDSVSNAELLIKRLGNQVIDIPTQVRSKLHFNRRSYL
jgi:transcription initiation factor TFIIE subunit beta